MSPKFFGFIRDALGQKGKCLSILTSLIEKFTIIFKAKYLPYEAQQMI